MQSDSSPPFASSFIPTTASVSKRSNPPLPVEKSPIAPEDSADSHELLDWINDHLPPGTPKAFDWRDMSNGRLYTRLVENLSGRNSKIPDSEFDKIKPYQPGRAPAME